MNLFVLNEDPSLAAQMLDDKRVGKALMECNMMMSTVLLRSPPEGLVVGPGMATGATHKTHPVTLWVGATRSNFAWCFAHAYALWEEFYQRYGKWHGSGYRLGHIGQFVNCLPSGPLLPFQNSARNPGYDLDFTHLPVPISYQEYLKARWLTDKRPPSYTNQEWPKWSDVSQQD